MKKTLSRWASITAICFLINLSYAAVSPIWHQADEQAHSLWAAAVVRGEFSVQDRTVHVPKGLTTHVDLFCWHPSGQGKPADCAIPPESSLELVSFKTTAANYPPFYYLLVGWPTLFLSGSTVAYVMRIISALIAAAISAIGLTSLINAWPKATALFVLAYFPTIGQFSGMVNPSALEMSGSLALWGVLLPIALIKGSHAKRILLAGPVASVLILSRPMAPLICALIIGVVAILIPPSRWRTLLAQRATWITASMVGLTVLVAGVWLRSNNTISSLFGGWLGPVKGGRSLTMWVVHRVPVNSGEGLIGVHWMDWLSYVIFAAVVIVASRVWSANLRVKIAISSLAVIYVLLPAIIMYPTWKTLGLYFQGRYIVGLAMGLVLLPAAVYAATRKPEDPAFGSLIPISIAIQVITLTMNTWFYWYGFWEFPIITRNPVHVLPVVTLTVGLGLAAWLHHRHQQRATHAEATLSDNQILVATASDK